jgi:hypothetical protein
MTERAIQVSVRRPPTTNSAYKRSFPSVPRSALPWLPAAGDILKVPRVAALDRRAGQLIHLRDVVRTG